MTLHVASAQREAAMNAIFDVLDGGSLEIRSGAQEADPEAAASGTLLGSCGLSATAFGAAVGGAGATVTKTANPVSTGTAVADGTAGHFRLLSSGGACAITGDVDVADSDLDMPVTVRAGATIQINSIVMTMPA